jgi:uncharacterized membrane protein (GlpM family)
LLTLKLILVPITIGAVSLAGRRWGPAVAGWLAGLPVVSGPILFLLWLDHGADFARTSAGYSLAAVTPVIAFSAAYAWACLRWTWPAALATAYTAWLITAIAVLALPFGVSGVWLLALASLLAAPRLIPHPETAPRAQSLPPTDIALRMLAGAALTALVTSLANRTGARVSGILALFPVMSAVLAVFTHRNAGAPAVIVMLRAFVGGLYSLAAFCIALVLLPIPNVVTAFGAALLISVAVQSLHPRR